MSRTCGWTVPDTPAHPAGHRLSKATARRELFAGEVVEGAVLQGRETLEMRSGFSAWDGGSALQFFRARKVFRRK